MQTLGDNIQYVYVLKEVPVALLPFFDIPLFAIITWRNTARIFLLPLLPTHVSCRCWETEILG